MTPPDPPGGGSITSGPAFLTRKPRNVRQLGLLHLIKALEYGFDTTGLPSASADLLGWWVTLSDQEKMTRLLDANASYQQERLIRES